MEGVVKLVCPATRCLSSFIFTFFSPPSLVFPMMGGGIGDGAEGVESRTDGRRPTLLSSFLRPFNLSRSLCSLGASSLGERSLSAARSLPLSVDLRGDFTVSKSSMGRGTCLLRERVAVRNVCSKELRKRCWKFLPVSTVEAWLVVEVEADGLGRDALVLNLCIRMGRTSAAMRGRACTSTRSNWSLFC